MQILVETQNLKTHFPINKGILMRKVGAVKAVDDVSLSIQFGQWLGLVGESGCGKTTLGKTILRLIQPTSGHIYFDMPEDARNEITQLGNEKTYSSRLRKLQQKYDVSTYQGSRLKLLRRRMQLVHQDPYTSLNPRMKIGNTISEPLKVHGIMNKKEIKERIAELLPMVGLSVQHMNRYPHQFSGGQRQRIAIARALSINPSFIVFDEPTSALDVSVQAQILNLLKQLIVDHKLTYLYITHNLIVAESVCDIIAVMYLGKIVEMGLPAEIFQNPKHPYSRALVLSTPIPDPTRKRGKIILPGEVPSPANPPSGCRFNPRCDRATDECRSIEPQLEKEGNTRVVACWHPLS